MGEAAMTGTGIRRLPAVVVAGKEACLAASFAADYFVEERGVAVCGVETAGSRLLLGRPRAYAVFPLAVVEDVSTRYRGDRWETTLHLTIPGIPWPRVSWGDAFHAHYAHYVLLLSLHRSHRAIPV